MKQLNIIMETGRIVINCEYMMPHDGMVYVMNEKDEIVGIFNAGTITAMWFDKEK